MDRINNRNGKFHKFLLIKKGVKFMKIALPVAQNKVCMHFGHCEEFAIFEVDEESKEIINREFIPSPSHQPGMLPGWLAEKGANIIITGGMGRRAQSLFSQCGIEVILGSPSGKPEEVVSEYLDGNLQTGDNICDH